MISKRDKKNTLSDKISDLLKAPDLQDPEDDIYEETKAKTVEADSDFENDDALDTVLSSFRKQNAKLLQDVDKKYSGKRVSRKSLGLEQADEESEESEVNTEDDNSDDNNISAGSFVRVKTNDDNDSEDNSIKSDNETALSNQFYDSDDEDVSHEESDTSKQDEDSQLSGSENSEDDFDEEGDVGITDFDNSNITEEKSDFKHVEGANASEAVQKGNAVRQQLHIWEKLMEMRIHTQKVLINANKLPRHDELNDFITQSTPEFNSKIQESKKLLTNLLNKFLDVQQLLVKKYPETKDLSKNDEKSKPSGDGMDEEIPSDTEDELEDKPEDEDEVPTKKRKMSEFPKILSDHHQSYSNYRNGVIQKWHDKVRVASGVINNKNHSANSLIKHIEHILDDKERLRKRTQLKRSKYDILTLKESIESNGTNENEESNDPEQKKSDEEYNTEIFDDDDFYHQLLRELIEYKTANVSDPVQLSKQWIELQQLRNKMKRKIDTKATKGRRIRYTVHSKLVNFMASEENSTWTDEAKDELFGSVFGRKTKT